MDVCIVHIAPTLIKQLAASGKRVVLDARVASRPEKLLVYDALLSLWPMS